MNPLRWLPSRRRILDLDAPLPEPMEFDPTLLASTQAYLRFLVGQLVSGRFDALYLFYHEADDCVRPCLWGQGERAEGKPGWHQEPPMEAGWGRHVLRDLRRRARGSRSEDGAVAGGLYYKRAGRVCRLTLESPHAWEVRLYVGDRRPPHLPYFLVPADETAGTGG